MLFNTIARLKEGDRVKFSGRGPGIAKAGCAIERSVTRDGGMSEPQLIFRFTEVAPL